MTTYSNKDNTEIIEIKKTKTNVYLCKHRKVFMGTKRVMQVKTYRNLIKAEKWAAETLLKIE